MYCLLIWVIFVGPPARTQVSPTNKNWTPRHPLAWETREAQPVCAWWVGLAPGELPSWSQLLQCIVSVAQLLKCPAFIAVSRRQYYGMFICCQNDLSVVHEGICRVRSILRRLKQFRGLAHGVEKTLPCILFPSSHCLNCPVFVELMVKFPKKRYRKNQEALIFQLLFLLWSWKLTSN